MREAAFEVTAAALTATLAALAAHAGMNEFHFLRVYRRVTGQTPHRHLLATRLRYAASRLRSDTDRIADIAQEAGFGDPSNFVAGFTSHFRVSPSICRGTILRSHVRAQSRD